MTSKNPSRSLTSVHGGVTMMGCALMASGEGAKAVALIEGLAASEPTNAELRSATNLVLSHGVPNYHLSMLEDVPRNAAFANAIARVVKPGATVLDIGTGSGLLAMMAARAGATCVVACEAHQALAETAREIISRNGLQDIIRVIGDKSTSIERDVHIPGGADVIIAEVFADNLLGEGALAALSHATSHLGRPGARVIPAAASIRAALAYFGTPTVDLTDVDGFDLSLFKRHLHPDHALDINQTDFVLRSEPDDLFSFDFQAGTGYEAAGVTKSFTAVGGKANGVVRWIRLQLDAEGVYENIPSPDNTSHWSMLFIPLPGGMSVAEGETLTVGASHDRKRVNIWFE